MATYSLIQNGDTGFSVRTTLNSLLTSVNEGELLGPTGATGPAGPQGETGEIGPTGATGPQGEIGPQGATGPEGPIGATGPQGATGPEGPIGATGPQGDIGPQGPIGATGPQGDIGLTGATGPQGEIGPEGPIGATGPAGADGADGATYSVSNLQIDTNDWIAEGGFFYKDVTLSGVLSTSYLTVTPVNASLETVKTAELSPLIEVNEDSFRIYAKNIPTASIDVFVVLFNN
jgi:hypothetical protein